MVNPRRWSGSPHTTQGWERPGTKEDVVGSLVVHTEGENMKFGKRWAGREGKERCAVSQDGGYQERGVGRRLKRRKKEEEEKEE